MWVLYVIGTLVIVIGLLVGVILFAARRQEKKTEPPVIVPTAASSPRRPRPLPYTTPRPVTRPGSPPSSTLDLVNLEPGQTLKKFGVGYAVVAAREFTYRQMQIRELELRQASKPDGSPVFLWVRVAPDFGLFWWEPIEAPELHHRSLSLQHKDRLYERVLSFEVEMSLTQEDGSTADTPPIQHYILRGRQRNWLLFLCPDGTTWEVRQGEELEATALERTVSA